LRVYDARFEIPAQSNLAQIMIAKGKDLAGNKTAKQKKDHQRMVRSVERFKKGVSAIVRILMALSMLCTMVLYSYNIVLLNEGDFFIARTR